MCRCLCCCARSVPLVPCPWCSARGGEHMLLCPSVPAVPCSWCHMPLVLCQQCRVHAAVPAVPCGVRRPWRCARGAIPMVAQWPVCSARGAVPAVTRRLCQARSCFCICRLFVWRGGSLNLLNIVFVFTKFMLCWKTALSLKFIKSWFVFRNTFTKFVFCLETSYSIQAGCDADNRMATDAEHGVSCTRRCATWCRALGFMPVAPFQRRRASVLVVLVWCPACGALPSWCCSPDAVHRDVPMEPRHCCCAHVPRSRCRAQLALCPPSAMALWKACAVP